MKTNSHATNHQNTLQLVQQARNPKGVTVQQLEQTVAQVSGFVKMMTGVANNAALGIMLDCMDHLRQHPRYKQRVKQLFRNVISERDKYRRTLMYPSEQSIRFFRVSDMPEESRKKYGVLSDKAYFEFWEGTGSLTYQRSQPLIGSLHNKFRLSLLNHQVQHPELVAWGLVGANMLELSVVMWQRAMKSACEAFEGLLTTDYIENLYRPFSLQRVSTAWQKAVRELSPDASGYELDEAEERNIRLGIEQLTELWISPDLPFDSTIQAVEDFQDDLFSTPGHAKKVMRELADMRNAAVRDLEEQSEMERQDEKETPVVQHSVQKLA